MRRFYLVGVDEHNGYCTRFDAFSRDSSYYGSRIATISYSDYQWKLRFFHPDHLKKFGEDYLAQFDSLDTAVECLDNRFSFLKEE